MKICLTKLKEKLMETKGLDLTKYVDGTSVTIIINKGQITDAKVLRSRNGSLHLCQNIVGISCNPKDNHGYSCRIPFYTPRMGLNPLITDIEIAHKKTKRSRSAGKKNKPVVDVEENKKENNIIPFNLKKAKAGYPVYVSGDRVVEIVDFNFHGHSGAGKIICIIRDTKSGKDAKIDTINNYNEEGLKILGSGDSFGNLYMKKNDIPVLKMGDKVLVDIHKDGLYSSHIFIKYAAKGGIICVSRSNESNYKQGLSFVTIRVLNDAWKPMPVEDEVEVNFTVRVNGKLLTEKQISNLPDETILKIFKG